MQRYEKANKTLKITETAHDAEHIKLVISEQKANDEAEKLRLQVCMYVCVCVCMYVSPHMLSPCNLP